MKCSLCSRSIESYDPEIHRLKIDDSCSADICEDCIGKFFRWQGSRYAKLFPTRAMKKRFESKV